MTLIVAHGATKSPCRRGNARQRGHDFCGVETLRRARGRDGAFTTAAIVEAESLQLAGEHRTRVDDLGQGRLGCN